MGLPTTSFTERGAAAGVAVELGEDDAVEGERGVEVLGDGDGVLAGHGVDDEERVVRLRDLGDLPHLLHQLGVDGEAAGGVDDHHVAPEAAGLGQAAPGHVERIALTGRDHVVGGAEDRHGVLLGQRAQLLDGGRALEVGADQQRVAALLLEPAGQLGRAGGLARALEAGHEDDGRRLRGVRDADRLAAQGLDQLLVDDVDDLLRRVQRLVQVGADATLADAGHQVADDLEVDVGLEQRQADLAQDLVDLGLVEAATPTEPLEDAFETVGK